MKRIVSLVLSLILVFSLGATAVYADTPFDDDSVIIDLPNGYNNEGVEGSFYTETITVSGEKN